MKEEFDRLIYDFLSGSITKEDLHKLNEWIYSDPENQKYFEQQKRIWLLSAEYKNVSVHEEQADLHEFPYYSKLFHEMQSMLNNKG